MVDRNDALSVSWRKVAVFLLYVLVFFAFVVLFIVLFLSLGEVEEKAMAQDILFEAS